MTGEARTLVMVVDTLQRGGLAKVEIELAQAFIEQGHCVGLLCLRSDRDYPLPEGLAWYAAWAQEPPRYRWQAVRVRRAQQQWIKERLATFEQQFGKAELVLGAGELCLRLMPALAHPALVLSSHSSQLQAAKAPGTLGRWRLAIKRWRRGARLRGLLNGQRVHVVSDGLAHELTDTLKVRPCELVTIYNPFDVTQLRHLSHLATPQSQAQTRPFVIGVGEFNTRKAFHRLIQALHDSGLQEDLVLVGHGPCLGLGTACALCPLS
jgi:glycosyltransferase involved in cell wall biosynthesis